MAVINFPDSPSDGATQTVGGITYTYSSSKGYWTAAASSGGGGGGGASVTTDDTAPSSPSDGDLWWDSDGGKMYVYYEDADSSQWVSVSVPGSTGPAGAAGAAATPTSYANLAAFPSSGNTLGDFAIAQDTKALYMWDGAEWDRIAAGSDESPRVTTEPPTSTQTLDSSGGTSTITMVAEDPEGFDIEYGIKYNTSGGALPSQLASATTINQSTGVYTFTPTTTQSNAGSFTARLTASDGNRVTTRNVPFNLAFYPAVSNLTARYDVGDPNSLTGTGTSWPDTSGNSATALTVSHNSGDGTVETGTWAGITVLNGGSVAGQHTTVTIPSSLLSSTSTIALIVALGNNDGSIAILNGSSASYHGYVHPTGTGYGFNHTYGGNAYINGGTASTGQIANNLLLGDTTKQQQLHSLIFDGVDWTTKGNITFNNYSSNSWRTLDFELRAIAIWDRALTAAEREQLHDYYLGKVASDKMAAWAG